ncbi:MAG: hypothetical protein ACYC5Y_02550 [Symbiobacteriia bacterium]
MRRWLWLIPVVGLVFAGCSSAAPPGAGSAPADSGAMQSLQAKEAPLVRAAVGGDDLLRTGSVPMDPVHLKGVQAAADAGRNPASLQPVETVRSAAADLGLDLQQDAVRLDYAVAPGAGSGASEAYVDVLHAGREYVVQLIQPVRSGPGGIWAVNSVQDMGLARDNALKLDTLRRYFGALAAKDYAVAEDLLARRFRQSTSPESLAGNSIQSALGVERITWNSPAADVLVVDIKLSLSGGGSAWGDGDNMRFARFVQEDGAWKIAALATSP